MDELIRGTIVASQGVIENGWVAIRDGIIAAIGQGAAPEARDVFDAGDDFVLPGVVDGQTHAGSARGLPGIESTTRSAVAGGVTTLVDMPYDNPAPLNSRERLAEKVGVIERVSHADMALYATVTPGQGTGEVEALIRAGVAAFKISAFESHPTRFPRISAGDMLDLMEALAGTDVPLGLHNEDQDIVNARIARAKAAGLDGIEAHSRSRPLEAELAATAHFLELGAASGAHVHPVHLTDARGFRLIDTYRARGYRATGELCVHYLWFDPDVDGQALGARMKVNPPIRPGEIEALWHEVGSGRVAFVSSDHSSWPVDNKIGLSIFEAGAGVPGLETLLPAFFTGAESRGLDAVTLTALYLSEKPARFFGLWPQKGALRVGADADIAILTKGAFVWDSAGAHDELNWSPFDGRIFSVRVSRTYLRGKLAWNGEIICNAPGDGRYLPRQAGGWFN
jgi:allantoinase